MRRVVRLALLIMTMATLPLAAAQARELRGQEDFIKRAVFADGRLWLLADSGDLTAIDPASGSTIRQRIRGRVQDICVLHGHPLILTKIDAHSHDWVIRLWTAGVWATEGSLSAGDDQVLGIECTADQQATILTTHRLIEIDGAAVGETALTGRLRAGAISSIHVDGEGVYVGQNEGEWGGGLSRIDRHTGAIAVIERNESGNLCGGPLNTQCDPVNGVATAPWKPGCVVAAIGLVHFSPHGRLVEVCGDQVRRIYFKPYAHGLPGHAESKPDSLVDSEPFDTVAFFGLIRIGEGLCALGVDGLYFVDKAEAVRFVPLPKFKRFGQFWLSFDLPNLVLVLTEVNERQSISGAVPMLVPR